MQRSSAAARKVAHNWEKVRKVRGMKEREKEERKGREKETRNMRRKEERKGKEERSCSFINLLSPLHIPMISLTLLTQ